MDTLAVINYLKKNGYVRWPGDKLCENVFHVYTKLINNKWRRVVVWFFSIPGHNVRVYTKE